MVVAAAVGSIILAVEPNTGEIQVFLRCPDVDPMHSPKIDIVFAVSRPSLYLNNLASQQKADHFCGGRDMSD